MKNTLDWGNTTVLRLIGSVGWPYIVQISTDSYLQCVSFPDTVPLIKKEILKEPGIKTLLLRPPTRVFCQGL